MLFSYANDKKSDFENILFHFNKFNSINRIIKICDFPHPIERK